MLFAMEFIKKPSVGIIALILYIACCQEFAPWLYS